jgi:dTMP kinase
LYLNGDFGSASDVTAYQASIFYAIDRYAASREIKDHLKKGGVIVSNRYTTANQIHQAGKIKDGKKQAQFLKWLDSLEHELLQIPRPEVTIFLDVPHKIGQKLVGKKDPRAYLKNGKTHDIHEADSKHLENTRRTALVVAKKFKWKKIDCIDPSGTMRSIADIHNEICTVIGV